MEVIIHVRSIIGLSIIGLSIIGLSVQLANSLKKYKFPYLTLWEDLEPVGRRQLSSRSSGAHQMLQYALL